MNSRSSSHGGLIHGFFHHLQLALIVASAIALLHAGGLLGWLDMAMLRLAANVQGHSPSEVHVPALQRGKMPVVFTVNQTLYEDQFLQTSPLDRSKLARIIQVLSTQKPAPSMLVIDLDLSPMAGSQGGAGQDHQKTLDDALKALVSNGTRLVLTTPFRVKSPELVEGKVRWMLDMCSQKSNPLAALPPVVFALSGALTNMGQVLQYDTNLPTLGMAAGHANNKASSAFKICDALMAPAGTEKWRDTLLSSAYSDEAMAAIFENSEHAPNKHTKPKLLPFNPTYLQLVMATTAPLAALDKLPAALNGKPYSIAGKTVFLGGSFDRADQFDTPLAVGKVPGVLIHALVFASEVGSVKPWAPIQEFALDIPIGFGCALLFQALWSWHRRIRAMAHEHGGVGRYLGSKASWLVILAVLMLLLVGSSLLVVHCFYPKGYWINPGPVMIGVAAKFLLSSMASSGGVHGHEHHVVPPRLHAWLDWGLVAALVAATLWFIQQH